MRTKLRRSRHTILAGLPLLLAGHAVPATAGTSAGTSAGTPAGTPDKVEVYRLHPSAAAAREAKFTISINWTNSGDRGAVMIVEDRHIPAYPGDDAGIGFAGAELADTNLRPQVYDHEHGVDYTDCQEPVIGQCSSLVKGSSQDDGLSWDYEMPTINDRPDPQYRWHDIYVGAVNARIRSIRLTGASWTQSPATNATMVLVENQDTAHGAGAHVANYTVEHFVAAQLAVPKGSWAAVSVRLPCPITLIGVFTPQDDARFSGYTLPDDGRPYIPLSCHGLPWADGFATGPATVRLTTTSTQPMSADDWTATQNLDRLIALVVRTVPQPRARH